MTPDDSAGLQQRARLARFSQLCAGHFAHCVRLGLPHPVQLRLLRLCSDWLPGFESSALSSQRVNHSPRPAGIFNLLKFSSTFANKKRQLSRNNEPRDAHLTTPPLCSDRCKAHSTMSTTPSHAASPSSSGRNAGPTPSAAVLSEKEARAGRGAGSASGDVADAAAAARKPRSCVTCRSRKVRCDKKSPCSNCRRAQIACVLPSDDKPPRWARRLDRLAHAGGAAPTGAAATPDDAGANQVMNRLKNLEKLVKNLSAELQQARVAGGGSRQNSTCHSPAPSTWQQQAQQASSPGSTGSNPHREPQPGRLIPGNSGQSQYITSGFWSQISDEVCIRRNCTPSLVS